MIVEAAGGRVLDVRVSGPEDGPPLVFHHGTPGAYVQVRALQRAAAARGLRLVTYSRPGYGDSTRAPGRRVADVAIDVAAVLDALGAGRALVAGWSGGGPHALATAARLGDRVGGALIIAGVGPYATRGLEFLTGMGEQNVEEFGLAARGEPALRPYLEQAASLLRGADPADLVRELETLLPDVDRAVLTDDYGEDMAASFVEALRTGVDGWLDDDLAFVRPWGFELDAIDVPVFLWQGSLDLMVPSAHGRWLAGHIPGVVAHLEEGEGHLSIAIGRLEEMLSELIAGAASS